MVEVLSVREELQMISDLVDGRLAGSERSEAVRRIDGDEALFEVFAEVARYRHSRTQPGNPRLRSRPTAD